MAAWLRRVSWRRWLSRLGTLLLVAMAGLAMAALVSAATGGRFLVVEGGSMRPALRPGDLLVVRPVGPSAVRTGDVVNYQPRADSASVTHRVIRVRSEGEGLRLTTKGDANECPDEIAVSGSNVRGRVVTVVPRVGAFGRLLRTPSGFAVGIVLPALVLAVGEVRRIRVALRERGLRRA